MNHEIFQKCAVVNTKAIPTRKSSLSNRFFLGYDTDEKGNLVINEEQAATVRRIYKEFLEGNGTNKIAKGLTEDKVKTGKGIQCGVQIVYIGYFAMKILW